MEASLPTSSMVSWEEVYVVEGRGGKGVLLGLDWIMNASEAISMCMRQVFENTSL